MDKVFGRMALSFVPGLRKRYADYLADCEADRANGHRPHYCEHGTNQWVDYDNICGPCEDGHTLSKGEHLYWTALSMAREALHEAHIRNLTIDCDAILDAADKDGFRAFSDLHGVDVMCEIFNMSRVMRWEREYAEREARYAEAEAAYLAQ